MGSAACRTEDPTPSVAWSGAVALLAQQDIVLPAERSELLLLLLHLQLLLFDNLLLHFLLQ